MTIIVYGSSVSPFVRKTLAFAAEKQLEVQVVQVGGAIRPPEFLEASPFGKMPAMRDGDFTVSDSTAIITYMEAIKPEPNLIPLDPKARARTIWYEEFADTIVGACMGKSFFNRVVLPKFMGREGNIAEAEEAEQVELPKLIAYLETMIPTSGFLVEDRITLADLAVASPFVNFAHVGCSVDAGKYPKTAKYLAGIHARPSYAGMIAQERGFLAA